MSRLHVIFLFSHLLAAAIQAGDPHPSLPAAGSLAGLGVNIHFTDPRPGELEMLAGAGFRWVRMDFHWGGTERQRGQYDFSAYDRLLQALDQQQLRAVLILDYGNPLYGSDRAVTTPEGREAFARWAAAAATHFQGRGILWEIWNEPNIEGFWKPAPSVTDYSALALAAGKAIRSAAAGEAIIGPASSTIDFEFLEGCFQAGLLQYWDAVSVHPYRQQGPETVAGEYRRLRKLIGKYAPAGRAIPILAAEWGYSAGWQHFDEESQGRMLPRQLLTNLADGIPLTIWYDWHDDGVDPREPEHHFGTVHFEYHAQRTPVYDPKPAYQAMHTLAKTLAGTVFSKRLQTERADDYVLLFQQGEQQRLAAWTASSSPHEIQLPASPGTFQTLSHLGEPLPAPRFANGALSLELGAAPRYLVPAAANALWAQAPPARPVGVELWPCPGQDLLIHVENTTEAAWPGVVALTETKGLKATAREAKFDFAEGETEQLLSLPLSAPLAGEFQTAVRVTDRAGVALGGLPLRKFYLTSPSLLRDTHVWADGDAQVKSEQSARFAAAPAPPPGVAAQTLRIDYRFDAGWKFLMVSPNPGAPRQLPGGPRAFGFWIYGDKQTQLTPRVRVIDATHQTWQPTAGAIHWQGWKYVEMKLDADAGHWGGANDGQVHPPLSWDSILLLDNTSRQPQQGTVYVTVPVLVY